MAQRRMISKSISTSTKLAEVGTFAKLLFTWIIPHCDDFGHMDGSARLVKAIVVPLCEESVDHVEKSLQELEKHRLIGRYEIDGRKYIEIPKWDEHQTLKTDRPLDQQFPFPMESGGSQRIPNDSKRKNKRREDKLREDKLREDSGPTAAISYLSTIPEDDLKEFTARFVATVRQVQSKAEDLKLYCERKGRIYKNYRSFLLNALKRDFPEREEVANKPKGKYSGI